MGASDTVKIILWLLFMWFFGLWIFGFCETFIRPASYPYFVFTNTNLKGCKAIVWFILLIIPGFMINAMIHGVWAIIQLILNCLPYCQQGCKPLASKEPPENIKPLIWCPIDKHMVHSFFMEVYGKCAKGSKLSPQ
mmetsp:Transcript_26803/g.23745  ORF Transcript_26803/g.23745 Transcript_26803/m.23745 type:complete len:136 (-) Transcript_26803:254-661(-)